MTSLYSKSKFASVVYLLSCYDSEPRHAEHVCALSLQLFDAFDKLHHLGSEARELLEAAALLHDIGWSQSDKGHHKASMKLILKSDLDGWNKREQLMIANIARYHRKALPATRHKAFMRLSQMQQTVVRKTASFLRLADAMDYSHQRLISKVDCSIGSKKVSLSLSKLRNIDQEKQKILKKGDLFEQTFTRKIKLKEKHL